MQDFTSSLLDERFIFPLYDMRSPIDKIFSLSCQKVADSILSSKMGNNIAKQASALLRYIPEYIRRTI